jgi:ketosteroid isomerase-like protein
MTTLQRSASTRQLGERLADVFRTADVGDLFTDDVFFDGHPPLWRFQVEGIENFSSWLTAYAPDGVETTVVRTMVTEDGFVTEFTGRHNEDGELMTDRKILLCTLRGDRIAEMTVYCSGDWDSELRTRHESEATLLRP